MLARPAPLGVVFAALSSQVIHAAACPAIPASQAGNVMETLEHVAHGQRLPRWKLLGQTADKYGRQFLVFFASDVMRRENGTIDTLINKIDLPAGMNADAAASAVQAGTLKPGALMFAHVDCAQETIGSDFTGAKMFETQLVSYVCTRCPQ